MATDFKWTLYEEGLVADRPAAGTDGRFYRATDEDILYRDNGVAWANVISGTSAVVLKSLFDANTILKADIDDTPEALTVATQRLVGRITGGDIAALTVAQISDLLNLTRTATLVVAANDSSALGKVQADYVCDGTADNVEIQAAIDALPASSGKVVLLEGNYSLATGIVVSSGATIEGQGYNTTLTATAGDFIFDTRDNDNIHLGYMKLDCDEIAHFGVLGDGSTKSHYYHLWIIDFTDDGIALSKATGSCQYVTVDHCIIEQALSDSTDSCIEIQDGANNIVITENVLIGSGNGVLVGKHTGETMAFNVVVANNVFYRNGTNSIWTSNPDAIAFCNLTVTANNVVGNSDVPVNGIYIADVIGAAVFGNIVQECKYGFSVSAASDVTLGENVAYQSTDNGFRIVSSSVRVTLTGCHAIEITGASHYGFLETCGPTHFVNCSARGCQTGFIFNNGTDNSAVSCIAIACVSEGFYIAGDAGLLMSNCVAEGVTGGNDQGFRIVAGTKIIISHCISRNQNEGVYITGATTEVALYYNDFRGNDTGYGIRWSSSVDQDLIICVGNLPVTGLRDLGIGETRCFWKTINFDDVATVNICSVNDGYAVTDVWVNIQTLFDDAGATLNIGDGGDADGFLPTANISLGVVGYYSSEADERGAYLWDAANSHTRQKVYAGADTVDAFIGKTDGTQGKALICVKVTRIGR